MQKYLNTVFFRIYTLFFRLKSMVLCIDFIKKRGVKRLQFKVWNKTMNEKIKEEKTAGKKN